MKLVEKQISGVHFSETGGEEISFENIASAIDFILANHNKNVVYVSSQGGFLALVEFSGGENDACYRYDPFEIVEWLRRYRGFIDDAAAQPASVAQ